MKEVAKQMQLIREEISKYESEYNRKPKIIITSYSLSVFMKVLLIQECKLTFEDDVELLNLYGIDLMTSPRLKDLEFEIY